MKESTDIGQGKKGYTIDSMIPRVSVIIPVYNVESYIEKCIASLENQTLKDIEYIFVDDKSTDRSMEKVYAFADSDKCVRIIHCEENSGPGHARNLGITYAHGNYLAFLDPDDYVPSDFYERLYNKATEGKGHDIAKGCRKRVTDDGCTIADASDDLNKRIRKSIKSGEPLYRFFSYEHTTALYAHHLFASPGVRYGEMRSSEDVFFLFTICNQTNDIVFDDEAVLSYLTREGSLTNTVTYEKHLGNLKLLYETIKWINAYRIMNTYDYSYLSNKMGNALSQYKKEAQVSLLLKRRFDEFLAEALSIATLLDRPYLFLNGNEELIELYNSQHNDKNYSCIISVIIPMYNCEQFVPELLAMFSGQSFTDFELICVIDGATDGTEAAVKKFCETDDRFRYVVRENGGAGAARNTGMDMARGKYIIFPDADDLYSKDYLLKLYVAAEMQNADIAVCSAATVDFRTGETFYATGFNKKELYEDRSYSYKNTKHILGSIGIHIGGKLYLTDYIKKNNFRFSETKVGNDLFFSRVTIMSAESIAVVHANLQTIRMFINSDSITATRYRYSDIVLHELIKIYSWIKERCMLPVFIQDYFKMVDNTVLYEIRSGINHSFAVEMARMLNFEKPWIKLSSSQIKSALALTFDEKKLESEDKIPENISREEAEKIRLKNETIRSRNTNIKTMLELIKREALEKYDMDFDVTESEPVFEPVFVPDSDIVQKPNLPDEILQKAVEDPLITVVIPMYNCEEYAHKAMSAFALQSFVDYEVVCVIDGATDNTEEIVSRFCSSDPRFRYTVKENEGPGAARNAGIDMARGEYIVFSDADDEYSKDYLKKLYDTALRHDAQIVMCLFLTSNALNQSSFVAGFDRKTLFENFVYSHYSMDNFFITTASRVTNKMFSVEYVRMIGARFPDTSMAEDAFFSFACISLADRILVTNDVLINYRVYINKDSISSGNSRHIHEVIISYRRLYQWLKEHSLIDIHGKDFMRWIGRMLCYYGSFEVTPRFILEFAHMLNEEEPWNTMSSKEVLNYLKEGLLANDVISKEKELRTHIDKETLESDEGLSYLLEKYQNRIRTSKWIRQVSSERYGRVFEQPDNFSITRADKTFLEPNDDSVRISVILPVYNVELYISRCIESLKAQRMDMLEFIFVDDCSTDNSIAAAEAWAAEDERVRILKNEKNMGAGISRNRGIDAARGCYLSFVDPDDYVSSDFYTLLWNRARKEGFPDIVKGSYGVFSDTQPDKFFIDPSPNIRIRKGLRMGDPLWLFFRAEHQSAIFLKEALLSSGARYGTSRACQDTTFLLRICSSSDCSIAFEDSAVYRFVARDRSTSHNRSTDSLNNHLLSLKERVDHLLTMENTTEAALACRYLEGTLAYLASMGLSIKRITGDEKAIRIFVQDMREQVIRLQGGKEFASESLIFQALIEHDILIAMSPYAPHGQQPSALDWLLIADEWSHFNRMATHANERIAKQVEIIQKRAIDAMILWRKRNKQSLVDGKLKN